jgi:hypothetical protein
VADIDRLACRVWETVGTLGILLANGVTWTEWIEDVAEADVDARDGN